MSLRRRQNGDASRAVRLQAWLPNPLEGELLRDSPGADDKKITETRETAVRVEPREEPDPRGGAAPPLAPIRTGGRDRMSNVQLQNFVKRKKPASEGKGKPQQEEMCAKPTTRTGEHLGCVRSLTAPVTDKSRLETRQRTGTGAALRQTDTAPPLSMGAQPHLRGATPPRPPGAPGTRGGTGAAVPGACGSPLPWVPPPGPGGTRVLWHAI